MNTILYPLIIIFGLIIGNFSTSLFYRLPRKISMYGINSKQKPFCSYCSHPLKFYEYLPIINWITTRGRCNYCHHKIDINYFILEASAAISAFICFYFLNPNMEIFILVFALSICAILSILFYIKNNTIPLAMIFSMIVIGMIYRTLLEHSIFNWVMSISLGSTIVLILNAKGVMNNNYFIMSNIILGLLWCLDKYLVYYIIIFIILLCFLKITNSKVIYGSNLFTLIIMIIFQSTLSL